MKPIESCVVNLIDETKYFELLKRARELKDESAMLEFLVLMREAYRLQHVFFSVIDNTPGKFVQYGTYPKEWIDYYRKHNLSVVDPVFKLTKDQAPVLWENLEDLSEVERKVMEARAAHGVGPHGMTIPLVSSDGMMSLLSITGEVDGSSEGWLKRATVLFKEFRDIGMIMHAAYLHLRGAAPPAVELSARHIDCLRMIGHGMNMNELARFQGFSERTAKKYVIEARKRLRARNNAQALYNAIQLGFIEI